MCIDYFSFDFPTENWLLLVTSIIIRYSLAANVGQMKKTFFFFCFRANNFIRWNIMKYIGIYLPDLANVMGSHSSQNSVGVTIHLFVCSLDFAMRKAGQHTSTEVKSTLFRWNSCFYRFIIAHFLLAAHTIACWRILRKDLAVSFFKKKNKNKANQPTEKIASFAGFWKLFFSSGIKNGTFLPLKFDWLYMYFLCHD